MFTQPQTVLTVSFLCSLVIKKFSHCEFRSRRDRKRQEKASFPVRESLSCLPDAGWSAAVSAVIGFTWAAGGTHSINKRSSLMSELCSFLLKCPPHPTLGSPVLSWCIPSPHTHVFSLSCFVFGLRRPPPEPIGWSWHGSRKGKQRSGQLCICSKFFKFFLPSMLFW